MYEYVIIYMYHYDKLLFLGFQGYYFSKTVPAEEFESLIQKELMLMGQDTLSPQKTEE